MFGSLAAQTIIGKSDLHSLREVRVIAVCRKMSYIPNDVLEIPLLEACAPEVAFSGYEVDCIIFLLAIKRSEALEMLQDAAT